MFFFNGNMHKLCLCYEFTDLNVFICLFICLFSFVFIYLLFVYYFIIFIVTVVVYYYYYYCFTLIFRSVSGVPAAAAAVLPLQARAGAPEAGDNAVSVIFSKYTFTHSLLFQLDGLDTCGFTALHFAARRGHVPTCKVDVFAYVYEKPKSNHYYYRYY
jgi:hypothetical protein